MNANKLYTKFSIEKIWNKLKQHDKAMNSVLLILLPSNWILQDGKYKNTVQYSGFKSSDKLTVDLYDDGNLADLQLTEYEHYIDGFEIIDGALVAIASVKPTQTMTVVVKGGFQANESEVGDLSVFEDEINFLANRPVNNNILINSNFANPVNQRGITADTWLANTYGLDRWVLWNAGAKVSSINSNGITFFNEIGSNNPYGAVLEQRIELSEIEYEKPYTLSACIDGEIYLISTIVKNEQLYSLEILNNVKIEIDARDNRYLNVKIRNYNTTPITVKWAKLEEGEVATPYVPRLYDEEWLLCQRYYQPLVLDSATLLKVDTNLMLFGTNYMTRMRVAPTPTFMDGTTVAINSVPLTAGTFAIEKNSIAQTYIKVMATKNSHGYTSAKVPTIYGVVFLDAEL